MAADGKAVLSDDRSRQQGGDKEEAQIVLEEVATTLLELVGLPEDVLFGDIVPSVMQ